MHRAKEAVNVAFATCEGRLWDARPHRRLRGEVGEATLLNVPPLRAMRDDHMRLARRAVFAALATPALARAQTAWPLRTVRFVVPFAPGSPIEIPARGIAEHLAPRLGQSVIVESRSGAGGAVGALAVLNANDGHSFLFGSGSIAIQPALQPDIGYDPLRDFVPVTVATESPMTFAVLADNRIRDLPDLIARAKREPGRITHGSSGTGSTTHMVAALFAQRAGIQMTHVPYRGSGQGITAFLAGDIDIMVGEATTVMPHLRAGRARLLAQTAATRSPVMPDTPTLEEVVPGTAMPIWFGMVGPRGTPAEVVALLMREIAPLRDGSALAARLAENGSRLVLSGPEAMAERLRQEVPLWREVVRAGGIRPE